MGCLLENLKSGMTMDLCDGSGLMSGLIKTAKLCSSVLECSGMTSNVVSINQTNIGLRGNHTGDYRN